MQLYDSIIHQMQPGQRERVDEEYHEKYDENWKLHGRGRACTR